MPVSSTNAKASQQKSQTTDNETQSPTTIRDPAEIKRRLIYKSKKLADPSRSRAAYKYPPDWKQVPDCIKAIRQTKWTALYFDYLFDHLHFEWIQGIKGKMLVVDLQETRWDTRETKASKIGTDLKTLKDVERRLVASGVIITFTRREGRVDRKYVAIGREVIKHMLIDSQVEMPNHGGGKTPPPRGRQNTPATGAPKSPPKNYKEENYKMNDGSSTSTCHTPTAEVPKPPSLSSSSKIEPKPKPQTNKYLSKEHKAKIFTFTDSLKVEGNKDTAGLNKLFLDMESRYSMEKCQRFVDNHEQTTWASEGHLESITEAFECLGNPRRREELEAAKKAKGEAHREKNHIGIVPHLSINKTDHNQPLPKAKTRSLISIMGSFAKDSEDKINRNRKKSEFLEKKKSQRPDNSDK